MTVFYHCAVQFEQKSKIPRDRFIHTFNFTASDNTLAKRAAIVTALFNFYNSVPTGGTNTLKSYMSGVLDSLTAPLVKFYDVSAHLSGTAAGSPVDQIAFGAGLTPNGGQSLPSEVAVCASYHSTYGSDAEFSGTTRPRARDRGRLFFGPLASSVLGQDAVLKTASPSATLRQDLALACATLSQPTDPEWCVWSRRAAAFKPVSGGFVDDAFDTQRRRGERAVVRTTW